MYGVDGQSQPRSLSTADYQSNNFGQSDSSSTSCGGGGKSETKQFSPFDNSNTGQPAGNALSGEIANVIKQLVEVFSKIISLISSMFGMGGGDSGSSASGGAGSGFGGNQGTGGSEDGKNSGGFGSYHGADGAEGGRGQGGDHGHHNAGGPQGGQGSGGFEGYKGAGGAGDSKGHGNHGGGEGAKGGGSFTGGKGGGSFEGGHSAGGAEGGKGSESAGRGSETPDPIDTSGSGNTIVVNKPIVVDGGVFDGKGATYTASSNLGDGGQGESQKPVFILKNGATLQNVSVGQNGADGIHVYGGATLKNVHWKDVGEDALTVKTAGDVNIIGGSAAKANDKIFQLNDATNFYVKDFKADGFQTFVRTNGGKEIDAHVTIDGGQFANGKVLFRTDSSAAAVQFLGKQEVDNVANKERFKDVKKSFEM